MILQLLLIAAGVSLRARYTVKGMQFIPANISACPGECVHTLTAILCDRVVDELPCNAPFLKCCVSKDLKFGTPVETSPPMPEDLEDPTENPRIVITTSTVPSTATSITKSSSQYNTLFLHTALSSTPIPSTTTERKICPGQCVETQYARYCGHIIEGPLCEIGTCCSVRPTTASPSLPPSTTSRPFILPASSTLPPGPQCPGNCVSSLFSLLCDDVMDNFYCPNEGKCCMNRPASIQEPTPAPCPGSCIPTFLSGVCNKPSKLILKTSDCNSGTICCFTPSVKGELNTAEQRPPPPDFSRPRPPHRLPPNRFPSPHLQGHHHHHLGTINPQTNAEKIEDIPMVSRPLEQPLCPGPCIASFLRFTCFGTNAIHSGFLCGKAGSVCCAPIVEIEKYEHMLPPTESLQKVSASFSTAGPSSQGPQHPFVCGVKGNQRRETPRIVGGADSADGEWCWQVALINAQNQYLCGGSLIGAHWVLTAAHCVTNLVRKGDVIYVRVGDHDLTSQFGSQGAQTHRVATTYVHHNHNSQTLDNDIALLKLQVAVDLKGKACLVCLPAKGVNRQAGKRCTVTGYGYRAEAGPISLKVRQTNLPIVDDQECSVKINAVTEKLFILPAGSFCAGGELGNDACQGDGGSPLVCQEDEYYELTGLVSWGFGCGRQDVPGVYVKVSTFIGWINQIISVNNT